LAGIDFFKKIVAYQQIYGLSAQLVSNNLQTNGLLLDEKWAKFFKQYHFFIGVSLDGPEEDHNRYRYAANEKECFQLTMKGLRILRDQQVEFGILTVVNNMTAKKPAELYHFFIRNGFSRLQFIPCVERDAGTGEVTDYSVTVRTTVIFFASCSMSGIITVSRWPRYGFSKIFWRSEWAPNLKSAPSRTGAAVMWWSNTMAMSIRAIFLWSSNGCWEICWKRRSRS
jgi:sulfatase maturation enzyme AslB (radical SAM superfamily)